MDEPDDIRAVVLLRLTGRIVAAHVGHNHVQVEVLPGLIETVHAALKTTGVAAAIPSREAPIPAVPWKKSVFADYIICLEDGDKLVSLTRRLKLKYELTPEQYREKWGLPSDYPMVAPGYSQKRSALARSFGLGRRSPEPQPPSQPEHVPVTVGRARKARGAKG